MQFSLTGVSLKETKFLSAFLGGLIWLALSSGCATNGRQVLLKEYGPTVPKMEQSALQGVAIAVSNFKNDFDIKINRADAGLSEPGGYQYQKMTPDQEKQWNQDRRARLKTSKKPDWQRVGYLRNGFGAVMSYIYVINHAGEWLADTLKLDLERQGARLVDASAKGESTVTLTGAIIHLKADMFVKNWVDLAVELEITVKGKPARKLTLHTRAEQAAWSTSSFEFYQSVRQCQQKLSRQVIAEVAKAIAE